MSSVVFMPFYKGSICDFPAIQTPWGMLELKKKNSINKCEIKFVKIKFLLIDVMLKSVPQECPSPGWVRNTTPDIALFIPCQFWALREQLVKATIAGLDALETDKSGI